MLRAKCRDTGPVPNLEAYILREVKTCIALTKKDFSGWLFQLVYMYISPNLIAVLGPLAICMLIHLLFHYMSYPSRSFQGYATEYYIPTPSLTPSYPCYHRREVSATRVPSCFEALVSLLLRYDPRILYKHLKTMITHSLFTHSLNNLWNISSSSNL